MADLRAFTRELMGEMANAISGPSSTGSRSITGTPTIPMSISWCAAAPMTARISSSAATTSSRGMRARAAELVTQELGPRSEHDIQSRYRPAGRGRTLDPARPAARARRPRHDGVIDMRRTPRPNSRTRSHAADSRARLASWSRSASPSRSALANGSMADDAETHAAGAGRARRHHQADAPRRSPSAASSARLGQLRPRRRVARHAHHRPPGRSRPRR